LIVALVALCVAPLLNVLSPVRAANFSAPELPRNPGAWSGPVAAQPSRWSPYLVGADAITRADYLNGTKRIEAFVALYSHQEQGKELTGYQNSLEGEQSTVIRRARTDDAVLNELELEHDGHRSLVWYFYDVGGLATSRALVAQLYYGLNSLVGAPVSKIVAWREECPSGDCNVAREDLRRLLESAERLSPYSNDKTARDS
jgi:EpsI family protein